MSEHFDQVKPDAARRQLADLGLDPAHPDDRARLPERLGCAFGLKVRPSGDKTWAVVWTEAGVRVHATG